MRKVNEITGMPKMSAAFSGWTSRITLTKVTQQIVDGFPTDVENEISFDGTIQPLNAEEIQLKPEGQRSWEWLQVHIKDGDRLETNDRIVYQGNEFKVMGVFDYTLNGYIEYHLVRDYQNG